VIGDGFGAFQGQLHRHRLGPVGAPAREARRRAVQLLPLHQIGPVLAQQGRQLPDQLLVASGTIRKRAPGHEEKRKVAGRSRLARTTQRRLGLALASPT